LTSLIPIGLFLQILGVKIISSSKVEITGSNPFPWPVTIKFRGLTVIQQEKKALVIFSDGQNITVNNNQAQTISIKRSN
jgi:endonuclease YncB( thermonuclease family)